MAEFADGGFVGGGLFPEINANELVHSAAIIQSFLCSRVRQVEPVLQEINAQHALNTDRSAPNSLRARVKRLDGFAKRFPRNDGFHVVQKLFLACLLAKFFETVGERCLLYISYNRDRCDTVIIAQFVN